MTSFMTTPFSVSLNDVLLSVWLFLLFLECTRTNRAKRYCDDQVARLDNAFRQELETCIRTTDVTTDSPQEIEDKTDSCPSQEIEDETDPCQCCIRALNQTITFTINLPLKATELEVMPVSTASDG